LVYIAPDFQSVGNLQLWDPPLESHSKVKISFPLGEEARNLNLSGNSKCFREKKGYQKDIKKTSGESSCMRGRGVVKSVYKQPLSIFLLIPEFDGRGFSTKESGFRL
jgi:hypothetical protein